MIIKRTVRYRTILEQFLISFKYLFTFKKKIEYNVYVQLCISPVSSYRTVPIPVSYWLSIAFMHLCHRNNCYVVIRTYLHKQIYRIHPKLQDWKLLGVGHTIEINYTIESYVPYVNCANFFWKQFMATSSCAIYSKISVRYRYRTSR